MLWRATCGTRVGCHSSVPSQTSTFSSTSIPVRWSDSSSRSVPFQDHIIKLELIPLLTIQGVLPELCEAIKKGDKRLADQWRGKQQWATVEQLILASGEPTSNKQYDDTELPYDYTHPISKLLNVHS